MDSKTFKTVLAVLLNIGISIAMVLVNKYLYVKVGFPNVTLTLMHFASTFICLHFCQLYGMFPIKKVPITKIIPLSITFCGFVVLTNLSLENNSVGTYQVAKVITTPCVMLIQYYAYGQKFSMNVIFTVVSLLFYDICFLLIIIFYFRQIPIVLGVCLNFMYDLKYNTLGTMYALLGVIVTSFYQVVSSAKQYCRKDEVIFHILKFLNFFKLVGAKQKEFQMSSMQLLYYQAPISAVILIVPMLIFEPVSNITDASWELIEVVGLFSWFYVNNLFFKSAFIFTYIYFFTGCCFVFLFDGIWSQSLYLLDHWKHLSFNVSFQTAHMNSFIFIVL